MQSENTDTASEPTEQSTTFADLGLSDGMLATLDTMGFVTPTDIQELAIPPLLEGRDIIGQARTGTGKTAAFSLPLLEKIEVERREVQCIVLAPTRELAMQVAQAMRAFAKADKGIRVCTVYGGQSIGLQIRELKRGVHVVVGTPGRVIDLLERKVLKFHGIDRVVLDEADEMLRMGFIEDIENILNHMPEDRPRQTALFSATMAKPIRRIADTYLNDPVDAKVEGGALAVPDIRQELVLVRDGNKAKVLDRLLEVENYESALVFARTKVGCGELAEWLERRGHRVAPLHGDMSQAQREGVLQRFRDGRVRLVVATDVAARGLDVDTISHVFNFDLPGDADTYVHRIGRTGRAGRKGVTITLCRPQDRQRIAWIERHTGVRMNRRARPMSQDVVDGRASRLREEIQHTIKVEALEPYLEQLQILVEEGLDPVMLAAAAAQMASRERPLNVREDVSIDVVPFHITAGRKSRISPRDIFGMLCNEAGLPREAIGAIDVRANHTEVWIAAAYVDALKERLTLSELRGFKVAIRLEDCRERIGGPRQKNRGRPNGGDFRGRPRSSGRSGARQGGGRRKPSPFRVRVDEGGWMSFDGEGSGRGGRKEGGRRGRGGPPRGRNPRAKGRGRSK